MARHIKPNQGTEIPSNLFFLDTETTRKTYDSKADVCAETFRLGCVIHCRVENGVIKHQETFRFYDPVQLWNFLECKVKFDRSNWVFAHNMHFDLSVLSGFDKFLDGSFILHEKHANWPIRRAGKTVKRQWKGFAVLEALPFIIRCRSKQGTIVFCDTLNYFPMSLAELALSIGMEKMPFPGHESTTADLMAYCENDTEIIKTAIINLMKYWKENDLGNWNYTAAGLSMNCWRHKFAPKTTTARGNDAINCIIHGNEEVLKLERRSYHGGEIQAFFRGYISPVKNEYDPRPWSNDLLYHVDCRSLFPFAMLHSYVPHQLRSFHEKTDPRQLRAWIRNYGVIADVRIKTDTIPFIVQHEDKILYAVGDYWTTLCGDELIRALDGGCVVESGRASTYYMTRLFAKYVKYWWQVRKQARENNDKMMDSIGKLAMNSLYGKFAQRSARWVECDNPPVHQWFGEHWVYPPDGKKADKYRFFCGYAQKEVERGEGKNSFPAISSFITANAREYMRQIREKLPPDSVYYQHTDSFICNAAAFNKLDSLGLLGDDIGQFREVDLPCCNAEIFGPGDYEFGGKIVRSGRKFNARTIDHDTFEQDEFSTIHETIQQGARNYIIVRKVQIKRQVQLPVACQSASSFLRPVVLFSSSPLPSQLPSPLPSQPSVASQARLFP